MTSVLIIPSSAVVRPGLAALLARKTLDVVVGQPGLALSQQIEDARPDVLLVDVGREHATAWLRGLDVRPLPPAIVLLTDDARASLGARVLRAGVRAVLPREASAEEIIAAVEAAAIGLVVLRPETMQSLEPAISSGARAGGLASQPLTPREIEILGMMAEGLGNKILAARLGISEHTVKFHIASIFAKLNAGSRTEAVTIGLRQGLIMI